MLKKIAIGFAVLIVVLAIGANYLWSNLDSIIKAAVEKYGSAATQTTVRLDSVKLSLTSGEGSLSGLSVGSPAGFSASKALYLGAVSVKIDTNSIAGNGPIVIRQIVIEKPQVTYEFTTSGDSNLQTIARNTQTYAASFAGKTGNPPATLAASNTSSAPGRKVIIDSLTINDGQVSITHPLLQGRQLDAPLPAIHLSNIGKSEGGATPAEVAKLVLGAISQDATQVAKTSVTQILGNLNLGAIKDVPGGVVNGATGTLGKAGGQIKNLFGQ
jgi:hypothetical protein